MFAEVFTEVANAAQALVGKNKCDPSTLGIVCMAFLCAVLPLDISQLAFAIIGAVAYALLQKTDVTKKPRVHVNIDSAPRRASGRSSMPKSLPSRPVNSAAHANNAVATGVVNPNAVRPGVTASVQPISAPTFVSKGWDGEIQELVRQIAPTSAAEEIVNKFARLIGHTVKQIVAEAEVQGIASGNLTSGKAFGVAVPEVDIIVSVSPQVLFERLHSRSAQGSDTSADAKKLQKCAIRTFTDRLVADAGFKFRRSAFRGQEPKVTLLAPASLGLCSESIPIDFSVNVVTPLYNSALLTECGKIDTRTKELILVVKRWAKDRGICHAAKGHLSPYMWGLLTIYYLQVGVSEEGSLLPPLDEFEMSASLLTKPSKDNRSKRPKWSPVQTADAKKSVGELVKEFVHFFNTQFDWCDEAVSIRAGQRAPASPDCPLHMLAAEGASPSQVGPSIEDPFHHEAQNLADGMNLASFARLKEELARADVLCLRDASLSELLEPWVPDDVDESKQNNELVNNKKNKESTAISTAIGCKRIANKIPDVVTKSNDWRRDAAVAQSAAAPAPAVTPPWRRTASKVVA